MWLKMFKQFCVVFLTMYNVTNFCVEAFADLHKANYMQMKNFVLVGKDFNIHINIHK